MLVTYIISLIVALITFIGVWRQGYIRSFFAYALLGTAAGQLVFMGLELAGWGGQPLFFVFGLLIIWAGLLWSLELTPWMIALVGVQVVLAIFAPDITLNLLGWGLPFSLLAAFLLFVRSREANVHFLPSRMGTYSLTDDRQPTIGSMNEETIRSQSPILECLDEGVVVSDQNGLIQFVNAAAAVVIGSDVSEIVGSSVMDVLSRLPMLDALSASNGRQRMQFEMNGRLIQGRIDVVYNDAGEVQGSVAVLRDITDEYQSRRAKEAFLTTVSHELRTPLTAIKGYVELFGSDVAGALNSNQKMFLDTIQRNVVRMSQLIDSMIFVSAVRGGRVQPRASYADLRQLTQQIVREMESVAHQNQQTIKVNIDTRVVPIQADSIHVSTILQELVNNSIKYNRPGGKVQIDVLLEKGESPQQEFVVVRVADTGIGIDSADQLFIFDDFFRSDTDDVSIRAGGMGVGLAIVRALVEAYNGRIWFDSVEGEGSTFTFILPTQQPDESTIQKLSEINM